MRPLLKFGLVLLLCSFLFGADDEKNQAKLRFKNGEQLVKKGEFVAAWFEIKAAQELYPRENKYPRKLAELSNNAFQQAYAEAIRQRKDPQQELEWLNWALQIQPMKQEALLEASRVKSALSSALNQIDLAARKLELGDATFAAGLIDQSDPFLNFYRAKLDLFRPTVRAIGDLEAAEGYFKKEDLPSAGAIVLTLESEGMLPVSAKGHLSILKSNLLNSYYKNLSALPELILKA